MKFGTISIVYRTLLAEVSYRDGGTQMMRSILRKGIAGLLSVVMLTVFFYAYESPMETRAATASAPFR